MTLTSVRIRVQRLAVILAAFALMFGTVGVLMEHVGWLLIPWGAAMLTIQCFMACYVVGTRPLPSAMRYRHLEAERPVPAGSLEWADGVTRALVREGFVDGGPYYSDDAPAVHFSQWLHHPGSHTVARLIVADRRGRGGIVPIRAVDYITRFADGGQLSTDNSPLPASAAPPPGSLSYPAPWITDATQLLALHRRLVATTPGRVPCMWPTPPGDPVAFDRRQAEESVARLVQFRHGVVEDGAVRLTVRGAMVATWYCNPLFRPLHAWRERQAIRVALGTSAA